MQFMRGIIQSQLQTVGIEREKRGARPSRDIIILFPRRKTKMTHDFFSF